MTLKPPPVFALVFAAQRREDGNAGVAAAAPADGGWPSLHHCITASLRRRLAGLLAADGLDGISLSEAAGRVKKKRNLHTKACDVLVSVNATRPALAAFATFSSDVVMSQRD